MNGSSNRVRLPVVDRKVDTGGNLLVGHGSLMRWGRVAGSTIIVNWARPEVH